MDIINLKHRKGIFGSILFTIFIVVVIFTIFKRQNEEKLLENDTEKTIATITKITDGAVHSPKRCEFKYVVNGKEYNSSESGDYSFLKIGDTILIEYSIHDFSISKISKDVNDTKKRKGI